MLAEVNAHYLLCMKRSHNLGILIISPSHEELLLFCSSGFVELEAQSGCTLQLLGDLPFCKIVLLALALFS